MFTRYSVILLLVIYIFVISIILINNYSYWPSYLSDQNNDIYLNSNSLISQNSVILWSSDFHISPIADIKDILYNNNDNNVRIIDKSLSGHCHLMDTCNHNLTIINKQNGIDLSPCPNELRRMFYDVYSNDVEFSSVDGILCNHAVSMCELFMPFNKPMVIIASTRYEIGRYSRERWQQWNDNLQLIANNPCNVIAANNKYDQEYIKYFTGIQNVELIPNLCNYTGTAYIKRDGEYSKGLRSEILLAPARGVHPTVKEELYSALTEFNKHRRLPYKHDEDAVAGLKPAKNDDRLLVGEPRKHKQVRPLRIVPIRDIYPQFKYSQLVTHPAIVLLPYQVSIMSLFEYYRMNIPIFIPSPELLINWHIDYNILNERTWNGVYNIRSSTSVVSKHPNSTSKLINDPNDDTSKAAMLEWILLSDFYQWAHIRQFNSWDELFLLLLDYELLNNISDNMTSINNKEKHVIISRWDAIIKNIMKCKHSNNGRKKDVNEVLIDLYGYKLSDNCDKQIYV